MLIVLLELNNELKAVNLGHAVPCVCVWQHLYETKYNTPFVQIMC